MKRLAQMVLPWYGVVGLAMYIIILFLAPKIIQQPRHRKTATSPPDLSEVSMSSVAAPSSNYLPRLKNISIAPFVFYSTSTPSSPIVVHLKQLPRVNIVVLSYDYYDDTYVSSFSSSYSNSDTSCIP